MSEAESTQQLILDTAGRIFADHCDKQLLDKAEQGELAQALWAQISENGFNHLGTADSGTDAADMFAFIQLCGNHAVPLPIAETLLVNNWCGAGDELYSIGEVVDGSIVNVPWGRVARKVVGVRRDDHTVVVVENPEVIDRGTNLAGEPRDAIALPADAEQLHIAIDPYAQLAVARCNQIAGSVLKMLDLGVQYSTERIQFGRAIAKFQAIQHSLAVVAAEAAAAKRAADAAVDALQGDRFIYEVAASKARVGEAATVVAEQIHQVHGAMGFTHEHRLHHYSRRAWAWRDEYGNEFYWQTVLGAHMAALGADNVWSFIATRG
jgi:alkylation response protein AidB-like acyl-CoA dehydrogenase